MTVYPNPASGKVNINYTITHAQPVKIEVTNMTGQKVKEINTSAHDSEITEEINVSDLRPGIYTVRLISQEGEMVRKLVVGK
jgi:Fe2+ transport system protein B